MHNGSLLLLAVLFVLSFGCSASTGGAPFGASSTRRGEADIEYQLELPPDIEATSVRLFVAPHVDMVDAHAFMVELASAARSDSRAEADAPTSVSQFVQESSSVQQVDGLRFVLADHAADGPLGVYLLEVSPEQDSSWQLLYADVLPKPHELTESVTHKAQRVCGHRDSDAAEDECTRIFFPLPDKAYTIISLRTGQEWQLVPGETTTGSTPPGALWYLLRESETRTDAEFSDGEATQIEREDARGGLKLVLGSGPLAFLRRSIGSNDPEALYVANPVVRVFHDNAHEFYNVTLPQEYPPQ